MDPSAVPRAHVAAGNSPNVYDAKYLNRREASRYLNLPLSWLANNTARGPRYIKVGRHVRYAVAALDSFMNANEIRCA